MVPQSVPGIFLDLSSTSEVRAIVASHRPRENEAPSARMKSSTDPPAISTQSRHLREMDTGNLRVMLPAGSLIVPGPVKKSVR
jgi:hypothetical protein